MGYYILCTENIYSCSISLLSLKKLRRYIHHLTQLTFLCTVSSMHWCFVYKNFWILTLHNNTVYTSMALCYKLWWKWYRGFQCELCHLLRFVWAAFSKLYTIFEMVLWLQWNVYPSFLKGGGVKERGREKKTHKKNCCGENTKCVRNMRKWQNVKITHISLWPTKKWIL